MFKSIKLSIMSDSDFSELIELDNLKEKKVLTSLYFSQKQCKDLTLTFWIFQDNDKLMKLEHRYGLIKIKYRRILIDEWCVMPISNSIEERKTDIQKCCRIYDIDNFVSTNKEKMIETDKKFIEMIKLRDEIIDMIGEYSMFNSLEYMWNIQSGNFSFKLILCCYTSEIILESTLSNIVGDRGNLKLTDNFDLNRQTLLNFLNKHKTTILKEKDVTNQITKRIQATDDEIEAPNQIKTTNVSVQPVQQGKADASFIRSLKTKYKQLFVKIPKDKKIEYQTCIPKYG